MPHSSLVHGKIAFKKKKVETGNTYKEEKLSKHW